MDSERTYSIGELAETANVSRRTVRFYVQRGLVDPPQGRGRGSVYTDHHVEQIRRVRALQRQGLELDAIRTMPGRKRPDEQPPPVVPLSRPFSVLRIPLLPGVRLEVDAAESVPSSELVDELARVCSDLVRRFQDHHEPVRRRESPREPPLPNEEGDLP